MKLHRKTIHLDSDGKRPNFHCITQQVQQAVTEAGIADGICVVYTHHTTSSVLIQECSFDET